MPYDNAVSVQANAIRITKLQADGTKQLGASAAYTSSNFTALTISPVMEAGQEIIQKRADGTVGFYMKMPDTLKSVNVSLAIYDPNPDLTAMLAGGDVLAGSKGYAAPQIGVDSTPNGVSIEAWSKAAVGSKQAAIDPYWHWVIPIAWMRQTGDRVLGEGLTGTEFSGWGTENPNFTSPATPVYPVAATRAYQYFRTTSLPTIPAGGAGYTTSA